MIKIIRGKTLFELEEKANKWIVENNINVLNSSISKIHTSYNDKESYVLVITYN